MEMRSSRMNYIKFLGGNFMNKFDNRGRSGKVAAMLLSALFSGSNSSAKETKGFDNKSLSVQSQSFSINKNDAKSPQSLERVGGATPITQRKFFKPLVIAASALVVAVAGGFTIWGLTRNKKKDEKPDAKGSEPKSAKEDNGVKDEQKTDLGLPITAQSIFNIKPKYINDNANSLSSEIGGNREIIINKNKEEEDEETKGIRESNEAMIDDALLKGKDNLKADSGEMKDAIFAVFKKVADDEMKMDKAFNDLIKICKNKLKINYIGIKNYDDDNDTRNFVCLFAGYVRYSIEWENDNVVSISSFVYRDYGGVEGYKFSKNIKLKDLGNPFKVKEEEIIRRRDSIVEENMIKIENEENKIEDDDEELERDDF